MLRHGEEFVLFKNRDFKRAHFDDLVRLTVREFGVLGLETWDSDDPSKDRFSGFSVGFNAHLTCCDSNVRGIPGGENYDKLVQAVVENCATIDEAIRLVRGLVGERTFSWCNMLVATPGGAAALEVRDHRVEVERSPVFVARANHHVCLGVTPDDEDTMTTLHRFDLAYNGLETVQRLDEVVSLLRLLPPMTHRTDGPFTTVYSYVVHWNEGVTTLYALQGHPCDGGEYVRLPIAFGRANDLSAYPSRRVVASG